MTMNTTIRFDNLTITNQTVNQIFASEMPDNTSQSNIPDYWYDMYSEDCNSLYCVFVLRYRKTMMNTLIWLTSLLGILGMIGALGNGIVIVVFVRSSSKHTSMYFMLMLAILDFVVCILVIPGVILSEWHFEFHSDTLCKILEMLRYFSIPTSAMILVAIACDRFVLICTPPNIRMSKTVCKIIIGIILSLGVGYSIPPVLGMGVYALDGMGHEQYTGYCIGNYMYITLGGMQIYWYVVTATFGIMIIIIVSLYTFMFITVYKQNRKWRLFHQNKIVPQQRKQSSEAGSMLGVEEIKKESCSTSVQDDSDTKVTSMFELKKLSQNTNDIQNVNKIARSSFDEQRFPAVKMRHSSVSQVGFLRQQLDCNLGDSTSGVDKSICTDIPGPSTSSPTSINRDRYHNQKWQQLRFMVKKGAHRNSNLSKTPSSRLRSISQIINPSMKTSIFSRSQKLTTGVSMPKVRSRRTHVKTTQVLFTVTMVYIVSFLPTFLISNSLLPPQKIAYYMYFINNAVNPLIYSFMNPRFRKEVVTLFRCRNRS